MANWCSLSTLFLKLSSWRQNVCLDKFNYLLFSRTCAEKNATSKMCVCEIIKVALFFLMNPGGQLGKRLLLLLMTCFCWFGISLIFEEHVTSLIQKHFNSSDPTQLQQFAIHKPVSTRCKNMLLEMTAGMWVPLAKPSRNSSYYHEIYHGYWTERKVVDRLWRDDGKCGNANKLPKVKGGRWPELPAWCNPSSDTPCCSDIAGGNCTAPSSKSCDCTNCLDVRKYHHAEMCEWKTDEQNCTWRNYSTGAEACDVIERSPFKSLHFVGDSLIRNMFYALLMILTDDPVSGAWSKNMNEQLKSYCRAEKFFFYKCREVIRSLDMLEKPKKLCGGRKPNFSIDATISYDKTMEGPLRKIVTDEIGQEGSIIFLHVGLHMGMDAKHIIKTYLKPSLEIRDKFYNESNASSQHAMKWPQIYFVPPLLPGLMKPRLFLPSQGKDAASAFAEKVKTFCDENDITFFDVRPFSKFVHSFDGTHYGFGVNLMKNQLMLNHFDSMK